MSRSRDQMRMIDPGLDDVLRPEPANGGAARAGHERDVEDAEFETVPAAPADRRPLPAAMAMPAAMPKPVIAPMPGRESGRLGVFAGNVPAGGAEDMPRFRLAAAGYCSGVVAVALVVFWIAGGHGLFVGLKVAPPVTAQSVATVSTPIAEAVPRQPAIEANLAPRTDAVEVIRAAPRPPRIERAGSILMIRGGGS